MISSGSDFPADTFRTFFISHMQATCYLDLHNEMLTSRVRIEGCNIEHSAVLLRSIFTHFLRISDKNVISLHYLNRWILVMETEFVLHKVGNKFFSQL